MTSRTRGEWRTVPRWGFLDLVGKLLIFRFTARGL